MKTRAAVAFEAKQPLEIVEVDLEGPEGRRSAGRDHGDRHLPHRRLHARRPRQRRAVPVDPRPRRARASCARSARASPASSRATTSSLCTRPNAASVSRAFRGKTNLCTAIRATQGKGVMPDGTSRFSYKGETIFHYMGCSTFSNFTVLPEIAVAKIREDAPFKTSCYIGCGVTTGVGAVINTAKVAGRRQCRRVRPRRHRPQRHPGREAGRREQDHRRRHQSGARGMGPQVRHDRLPQQQGHEPRGRSSRRSSR